MADVERTTNAYQWPRYRVRGWGDGDNDALVWQCETKGHETYWWCLLCHSTGCDHVKDVLNYRRKWE